MAATSSWARVFYHTGMLLPGAAPRALCWLAASNTKKHESQNPGRRVEMIVKQPVVSEQEGCQCCSVPRLTDPTAASLRLRHQLLCPPFCEDATRHQGDGVFAGLRQPSAWKTRPGSLVWGPDWSSSREDGCDSAKG